ncbi:uncharacterized [Tachysurus ichikawai]
MLLYLQGCDVETKSENRNHKLHLSLLPFRFGQTPLHAHFHHNTKICARAAYEPILSGAVTSLLSCLLIGQTADGETER